jgi:hypothetical protein
MIAAERGCVFFNFGSHYALRLLVALSSLRHFYSGPVTTFVARDEAGIALAPELERLDSRVTFVDSLSKSADKHRLFLDSPYRTTLAFDSDVLFVEPIDELWEPLEREGVLVTRFFPAPDGYGGPGQWSRVELLKGVRNLVDRETYAEALRRMRDERIDVNIGVMGISRPRGDAFLADWAERIERGRGQGSLLLDEMLVVALLPKHRHFLADEEWNCPADEFFRRTNLGDARVIHYFADGTSVHGIRIGRNPATWAGRGWYAAYADARRELNLAVWESSDPTFARRYVLAETRRKAIARVWAWCGRHRYLFPRRLLRRCVFPLQEQLQSALFRARYRVPLRAAAKATVIVLSYKRMANIHRIVRNALLCGFVDRVIVSNNNPDEDLTPFVPIRDARLELVQQKTHRGPSYRYDLARDYPSRYYICIDDDVFPTPWQLRRLFATLLRNPDSPVGSAGEIWDSTNARLMTIRCGLWPWRRDRVQPVDVLAQVHAFTDEHLAKYFGLLDAIGLDNASIHSSEDVVISFAGRTRPRLQAVGHVFECPSSYDAQIATHRREGFFQFRHDLFDRLAEAHAFDASARARE